MSNAFELWVNGNTDNGIQWLIEEALRLLYDSMWYEKGET